MDAALDRTAQEMLRVDVRVFGGLRETLGAPSLSLQLPSGSTVESLLSEIDRGYPVLSAALRSGLSDGYLNVLVNGHNALFRDGTATKLADGDAVAFLPPIGGG